MTNTDHKHHDHGHHDHHHGDDHDCCHGGGDADAGQAEEAKKDEGPIIDAEVVEEKKD